MIFKPIVIECSNLEPQPKCAWLKNQFIPADVLFPNYSDIKDLILNLLDTFQGILLVGNRTQVAITLPLEYPLDFPLNLKLELETITSKLIVDYTPQLKEYLGLKCTENTLQSMLGKFRSYEQAIISCGGNSLRDELAFRFGVLPYFLKNNTRRNYADNHECRCFTDERECG